ncbi:MAG: phage antirepressor KilAC domain-containing protein [Clostridium sp.]|uniref:phage antirepressor KilAC domain-containing protein n=1 Tax=Clostridium sp. TaxID=1506 RepID=UPI003F4138B4
MKELIRIKEENGKKLVSAKELYLGLGMDKSNWKKWYVKNIENNDFFTENDSWVGFVLMTNGNETKDFAINLEFAKHLAMMSRTEKSHEYRNYFIECEKQLIEVQNKAQLLLDIYNGGQAGIIASAKLTEIEVAEQTKELVGTIEEQAPKVEVYDKFIETDGTYTITNAAKKLGVQPRKILFPYLLEKKLLVTGNVPSSYAIKQNLMVIKDVPFTNRSNKTEFNQQARITITGIEYLLKNLVNKSKKLS